MHAFHENSNLFIILTLDPPRIVFIIPDHPRFTRSLTRDGTRLMDAHVIRNMIQIHIYVSLIEKNVKEDLNMLDV